MKRCSLWFFPIALALSLNCVLLGSCGGGGSSNSLGNCPSGTHYDIDVSYGDAGCIPNGETVTITPGVPTVLLSLTYSVTTLTYGQLLGFDEQNIGPLVTLTAHQPVQFVATDSTAPHTAAFLGAATSTSAPWPAMCSNVPACVSTTASPANTVINAPGFTTGPLSVSQVSNVYLAPGPGFWMFGCHYHYDSKGMRTVITSM
jgi:hypothetical protein